MPGWRAATAGSSFVMAPRAIWTGSVSFGLVNVRVRLLSATQSKDVHFNQFKAGTTKRIHNKRVAEGSNAEVDFDDIVKGYELPGGKYVMVEPEDLESAAPEQTRTIEIEDFVDLADIDPIYYEKSYYLAPDNGTGADRAYALLREAMGRSGKVAIGRFVLRTKQYLACIRPVDKVLVLSTLFFADEVRDTKDIGVPGKLKFKPRELEMAQHLVESLSTGWKPSRYKDTYREDLLGVIKAMGAGKEIEPVERPERTDVGDLMAALEASIAARKEAPAKKAQGHEEEGGVGTGRSQAVTVAGWPCWCGSTPRTRPPCWRSPRSRACRPASWPAGCCTTTYDGSAAAASWPSARRINPPGSDGASDRVPLHHDRAVVVGVGLDDEVLAIGPGWDVDRADVADDVGILGAHAGVTHAVDEALVAFHGVTVPVG